MSDSQGKPGRVRSGISLFASHWLALAGLGIVITAIVLWACLLPAQLRSGEDNPYIGLATFLVGGVLLLGLILVPFGLMLGRRRLAQRLSDSLHDSRMRWRSLLVFLVVTSAINVVIASQMTLRVVHGMESRQFCSSCHVMTPEARAFDQGPHAGILCVDCHVGDGAAGFLKSKMQGTRQLYLVLTDKVEKPIATAIESGRMVPSAETCEGCHWKDQPAAARMKLIQSYAEDETNTPETTLLTMNVGGARMGGIHGSHHGEGIEIRFAATDAKRQDIPWVEYTNSKTGEHRVYSRPDADAAELAALPRVDMQCFDCHNRPAHAFLLPERAVDRALTLGRMSRSLPFIKQQGVAILKAGYADSAEAAEQIPAALESYYKGQHPELAQERAQAIAEAGAVLADIYSRNVFPELGVDWGTYPDNRGHEDFPGCFRCHDGELATADGEKLTNNCFVCHFPAAVSETEPEVLELLGVNRLLKQLDNKD
jgi:nitrate/TMAO reductase-like tetraheme cytochrome c subunit